MEDPFYKIVFIGGFQVGKTAIVNALMGKRFVDVYAPTMGMSFQHLSMQQKNYTYEICDTSGASRFNYFVTGMCNDAHLICLVVDATKSIKSQIESIKPYKSQIQEIKHPIPLLLIANHRNSIHRVLTENDLISVGIDANDYILLSAEQIAADAAANQASLLNTKIAEKLDRIRPSYPRLRLPNAVQRTPTQSSFSPLKWFNHFFQSRPTPNINTLSVHSAIDTLSREKVQTILQSIHKYLTNGPLNNTRKPYDLGPFCFSGTRHGGYRVVDQSFKCRTIFFESKAKYPNHIMTWLSMTMVSMTNNKAHTLKECEGNNLHRILKYLYDEILSIQNSFSFNLFRKSTTKSFYKNLPKIIEDEIMRVATHYQHAVPLAVASPLVAREQLL